MVYGREGEAEIHSFGLSGYTYNNTFVLYDRTSDSLWYPQSRGRLEAVSGPHKGTLLEVVAKPQLVSLNAWLDEYPDSLVLLPPPLPLHRAEDQPGWLDWDGRGWKQRGADDAPR